MKRSSLTLTAALLALAAAAQPRVTWLETDHNFGAFSEDDGAVTAVFRYVNTGTAPLVITGARANCGCTTPRYDPAPLAPGDTAAVSVTFDSRGQTGKFSKKAFIDTNTTPERSTLIVRGTVIGNEASVAQRFPTAMGQMRLARPTALLGTVSKGHIKNVFLKGYNASATDSLRPAVADVPDWVDVTLAPPAVAAAEQFALSLMVRPDRTPLYGVVMDTITIIPDPVRSPDSRYRLPIVATINEDFSRLTQKDYAKAPVAQLSADRVDMGELTAGQTATAHFTITNAGKSTLKIRRIYTSDPGIVIRCKDTSVKPGKSADVTFLVTPTLPADASTPTPVLNARISIITSDPVTPLHTLRLVATLR